MERKAKGINAITFIRFDVSEGDQDTSDQSSGPRTINAVQNWIRMLVQKKVDFKAISTYHSDCFNDKEGILEHAWACGCVGNTVTVDIQRRLMCFTWVNEHDPDGV